MSTTNVTYLVTVKDNFSKATGGAKKQLGGISNLLGGINPAMIGATAAAAVLAKGFKEIIDVASKFEKSMTNVRALMGDISDQKFGELQEQAKTLGATTAFSASQAADGMTFLAQAGFQADQIMNALPATLSLAAAGSIGLAEAADLASNVLSGYGFEANQMAAVSDVMAKTFTSSNTDLNMLAESFKEVAPIASGLGLQFTEVSAAIGILGNSGIQGSKAGTALKNAFTRLAAPTTAIQTTLDKLGISVNDSDGKMRSLEDIVGQLEKSGASTSEIMTIFGKIAGGSMIKLVDAGSDSIAAFNEQLQNAGGTADQIAEDKLDNFAGSMTKMKSAWEGLILSFEDGSGQIMKGLRAVIDDLTLGFSILSGNTDQTVDNFSVLGQIMINIKNSFKIAIFQIKLLALPFIFIFKLVKKLGERFGWFGDQLDGSKDQANTFMLIIQNLGDVLDVVFDSILSAIDPLVDAFVSWFAVGQMVWEGLIRGFTKYINFMKAVFSPAINVIKDVFVFAWDVISNHVANVWNFLSGIFESIKNWFVDNSGLFDPFVDGITAGIDFVVGLFTKLGDLIQSIFEFDTEGIKSNATAAMKSVGEAMKKQGDLPLKIQAAATKSNVKEEKESGALGINTLVSSGLGGAPSAGGAAGGGLAKAGDLGADVAGAKGTKLTNINITINKLVEELNIKTTNLTEGAAQAREEISRALLTAVNDVNIIAQ
jgi:TP901 family phage tail tape measure protein